MGRSRRASQLRRGEDPPGAGFDIAGFTREVLAALDKVESAGNINNGNCHASHG